MLDLRSGTAETLLIDVEDKLGNLTDLSGAAPRYDVYDKDDNLKLTNLTPIVDPLQPMTARCLVDTTIGGNWAAGHYRLYLRYLASPDSPRLGPFEFKVNP
jgi:hypothetical protein